MSRIMGIDYGQNRIGIAISDELQLFATPYQTLTNLNKEAIFTQLRQIIEKEQISKIVVGLPYFLDGTPSKQTERILKFIKEIQTCFSLPVETFDERYSSVEANKILIKKGISIRKSKEKIDQIAASIILQNYLNREDR